MFVPQCDVSETIEDAIRVEEAEVDELGIWGPAFNAIETGALSSIQQPPVKLERQAVRCPLERIEQNEIRAIVLQQERMELQCQRPIIRAIASQQERMLQKERRAIISQQERMELQCQRPSQPISTKAMVVSIKTQSRKASQKRRADAATKKLDQPPKRVRWAAPETQEPLLVKALASREENARLKRLVVSRILENDKQKELLEQLERDQLQMQEEIAQLTLAYNLSMQPFHAAPIKLDQIPVPAATTTDTEAFITAFFCCTP